MKVKEFKNLLKQVDNAGLLFNKFLPFLVEENVKNKDYISKFFEVLTNKSVQISREYLQLAQRRFSAKTSYRLVLGMGNPSVIEVGFLFDHVYGVPYISGNTLKGLARHVFLLSLMEAVNYKSIGQLEKGLQEGKVDNLPKKIKLIFDDTEIISPDKTFLRLFGSQSKRGEVIFFDAFPKAFKPKDNLAMDIMNPHYGDYYQEKGPPGDWLSPVPVHFLVVKEDTEFEFGIGSAPLEPSDEEYLLDLAERLLIVGLENFGVGGKKTKGYGWFYGFEKV